MTSLQALRELAEKAEGQVVVHDEWRRLDEVFGTPGAAIGRLIKAMNPRILTALLDVVEKGKLLLRIVEFLLADTDHMKEPEIVEFRTAITNLNSLLETENGGEG